MSLDIAPPFVLTKPVASVTDGRIDSHVLPGLWIDAGRLWQQPLPSTMRCLRELLGSA